MGSGVASVEASTAGDHLMKKHLQTMAGQLCYKAGGGGGEEEEERTKENKAA